MMAIEKTYPVEPTINYFTRVLKAFRLFMIFNSKDSFLITFMQGL